MEHDNIQTWARHKNAPVIENNTSTIILITLGREMSTILPARTKKKRSESLNETLTKVNRNDSYKKV